MGHFKATKAAIASAQTRSTTALRTQHFAATTKPSTFLITQPKPTNSDFTFNDAFELTFRKPATRGFQNLQKFDPST
jgi:hypothetical protein